MVKQHWGEEEEEVTLVAPLLRWRWVLHHWPLTINHWSSTIWPLTITNLIFHPLFQLSDSLATGFATVQGHDDTGSDVSRRFFRSSSCSSNVCCPRSKCFGSNVRAWTQRLRCCLYGLNGLWTPGGISLLHHLNWIFTVLWFAGVSCRPLSVRSKFSSSNIVRSALRRPHGSVRSHGVPPRGSSPWISRSTRSAQERVRDDPVICELLPLNPWTSDVISENHCVPHRPAIWSLWQPLSSQKCAGVWGDVFWPGGITI